MSYKRRTCLSFLVYEIQFKKVQYLTSITWRFCKFNSEQYLLLNSNSLKQKSTSWMTHLKTRFPILKYNNICTTMNRRNKVNFENTNNLPAKILFQVSNYTCCCFLNDTKIQTWTKIILVKTGIKFCKQIMV